MNKVKIHFQLSNFSGVEETDVWDSEWISHKLLSYGLPEAVYLFIIECGSDLPIVIVTEYLHVMISAIDAVAYHGETHKGADISIQQYKSYEDAYSVALTIMEVSEKCYN